MQRNNVAFVLKIFGVVNAISGAFVALALGDGMSSLLRFAIFLVCLISGIFVYAFGEIIQLLADIKSNTTDKGASFGVATTANTQKDSEDNQLPSI